MDVPAVCPALSRVGLEVEAVVRLGVDERSAQPFAARIDCAIEPRAESADGTERFETAVAEVVREVVLDTRAIRAERLVREVAERVRERLAAPRAEVTIAARFRERAGARVRHRDPGDLDAMPPRSRPSAAPGGSSASPRRG